ncbi:MAG: Gfo/Idh/MocA family protein, partial [Candidatus Limnocylindrales bacterium]
MTVQLAQVGLGYWGPNLARNFANVEGAELAVLCDAEPARLERMGRQIPGARRVADFGAVLADDTIDGVVIATPVNTHFAMAERALRAGKHVLVEKPLATTSAECEVLIALAEERDLRLMVGHVFVYNPAVRRVKEIIDSGELGDIYYIYSQRLNLGQVRQDVNAMWIDPATGDVYI